MTPQPPRQTRTYQTDPAIMKMPTLRIGDHIQWTTKGVSAEGVIVTYSAGTLRDLRTNQDVPAFSFTFKDDAGKLHSTGMLAEVDRAK